MEKRWRTPQGSKLLVSAFYYRNIANSADSIRGKIFALRVATETWARFLRTTPLTDVSVCGFHGSSRDLGGWQAVSDSSVAFLLHIRGKSIGNWQSYCGSHLQYLASQAVGGDIEPLQRGCLGELVVLGSSWAAHAQHQSAEDIALAF